MACTLGYYIDATTGKSRQCADGTYQSRPSRVNILSYKDGLQSRFYKIQRSQGTVIIGIILFESVDIDL